MPGLSSAIPSSTWGTLQSALGSLVLASVYVPNGKDYSAKLAFLSRLVAWVKQVT